MLTLAPSMAAPLWSVTVPLIPLSAWPFNRAGEHRNTSPIAKTAASLHPVPKPLRTHDDVEESLIGGTPKLADRHYSPTGAHSPSLAASSQCTCLLSLDSRLRR